MSENTQKFEIDEDYIHKLCTEARFIRNILSEIIEELNNDKTELFIQMMNINFIESFRSTAISIKHITRLGILTGKHLEHCKESSNKSIQTWTRESAIHPIFIDGEDEESEELESETNQALRDHAAKLAEKFTFSE